MGKLLGTLAAAGLLAFGMPSAAEAQEQDGLVNVVVGDITIAEDVNIGIGAQIVAQVCDVKVGPVAVLARTVDRSGDSETVCTAEDGTVELVQN